MEATHNTPETFAEPTMRWDFFYRTENSRLGKPGQPTFDEYWDAEPAPFVVAQLPVSWDVEAALVYMRKHNLLGKGTYRSGCFEVQNDLGIWASTNNRAMRFATPGQRAKVVFTAWDDLVL